MAVRNVYLSARADGRASAVGLGPARADGGLTARYTVRDGGTIRDALTLDAWTGPSGIIMSDVGFADGWTLRDKSGEIIARIPAGAYARLETLR